jgi:prepilin-type N-terminal cleavage/methylation domain-containing protein
MLKKKKGFALIELLIVLFLIGIVVVMTINFSVRNRDRWSLRDTTRELTSTYYQAKQRASRENASVRLAVGANGYTLFRDNAGVWEVLKNEIYPAKITASLTANFMINPSGFIIDPGTLKITGSQTITLTAPRGTAIDSMTITIYPYGGLRVEKAFK